MKAKIIEITNKNGGVREWDWLAKAESVHRQLRPSLPGAYADKMTRIFRDGGRMSVAVDDNVVVGLAVYRIHENTAQGVQMYVDDLVTDEKNRSAGYGKALMDYLQLMAVDAGCENFTLDSGTQHQQAHKFYFREGMIINSFHFSKSVNSNV